MPVVASRSWPMRLAWRFHCQNERAATRFRHAGHAHTIARCLTGSTAARCALKRLTATAFGASFCARVTLAAGRPSFWKISHLTKSVARIVLFVDRHKEYLDREAARRLLAGSLATDLKINYLPFLVPSCLLDCTVLSLYSYPSLFP